MKARVGATVLALLLMTNMVGSGTASAAESPPPLTNTRFNEDYRYLLDPNARTGAFWEPFKAIPLTSDGSATLSFGQETRLRFEAIRNSSWGQDNPQNDAYGFWRVLPYADLRVGQGTGPSFRVFGQLILADAVGKLEPLAQPDADRIDLMQGFADFNAPLGDAQGTLRIGRQMLSYGSERLISIRYGANVPRSFDAVTGIVKAGPWRVDAFLGRPVRVSPKLFDDERDGRRAAWALYATRPLDLGWGGSMGLDAYYIGYRNDRASFNAGTGREERHTLGTRFFGKSGAWDWNWEAMGQFGSFGTGSIQAWSLATDTGYRIDNLPLQPRFGLKANIASGDTNPRDGTLETFNPLFPRAKYFGELTPVGPFNLMNLHPSVDLALSEEFSLNASAIAYWRESLDDGVYDLTGGLLRSGAGSGARYIGTQGELVLSYSSGRTFEGLVSYSIFQPGAFIKDTGPAKTTHFVGMEAVFKF